MKYWKPKWGGKTYIFLMQLFNFPISSCTYFYKYIALKIYTQKKNNKKSSLETANILHKIVLDFKLLLLPLVL